MAVDMLTTYGDWKQNFLAEIDAQSDNVAKGDEFVSQVLQAYYALSEDDAINATECAGPGDHGIDAIYVFPPEDDAIPRILVVQGKYGAAGAGLSPFIEATKLFDALNKAATGKSVTDAVDKVAYVLKNQGTVQYVIATVDPLDDKQLASLGDIKKLANIDFGNQLIVKAISLENLYDVVRTEEKAIKVDLPCEVVKVTAEAYIGIARLADMYMMLTDYGKQSSGTIDSIYDHNIRKYIKRSASAVNRKIYETLEKNPSHFIAYNNGITITCQVAEQLTQQRLRLDSPQIVNGCQTTRTLYEFMDKHFAGIDPQHDVANAMSAYREAFMAVKVLVVQKGNAGDDYAKNITRNSNNQNVIRGKDFIALEDMYRRLKEDLKKTGYFLETQKGEYAALSKAQQKMYPKATSVIDSFEATLFYAAGVLGKPQDAFGRSGEFAPGGLEFEGFVNKLSADSLFIPWKIAQHAQELGYAKGKSIYDPDKGTGHRAQTRHLFQYMFFRLMRELIAAELANKKVTEVTEEDIYNFLDVILKDYEQNSQKTHPFYQLLVCTDEGIKTFMTLAEKMQWYTDRNAFLKSQALMQEDHFIMAIAPVTLKLGTIAKQIQLITSKTNS